MLATVSGAHATPIDLQSLMGPTLYEQAIFSNTYVSAAAGSGTETVYGNIAANTHIVLGANTLVTGNVRSGTYLTTGDGATVGGNVLTVAATTVGANSVISGNVQSGAAVTLGVDSQVVGTVQATAAITLGAGATSGPQTLGAPAPVLANEHQGLLDAQDSLVALDALTGPGALSAGILAADTTFTAGVYSVNGFVTVAADKTISLDAQGQDSEFIFNIHNYLSLGAGVKVIILNGTDNTRVIWNVTGGYVSMGANSNIVGTILANGYVVTGANSIISGAGDSCAGVYSSSYIFIAAGATIGTDTPCGAAIQDTDSDGLLDTLEVELGTDPTHADSDGDGVDDGEEVDAGTNPVLADTDADGLTDGEEAALGTNPNLADSDGDGLTDGNESDAGTDPNDADSDADGLTDGEEAAFGTNPNSADTDGDGLTDLEEVAIGSDPNEAGRDPSACGDEDGDSCNDCALGASPDTSNDGLDRDADGMCDRGDSDMDGDTVNNSLDDAPLDPFRCEDTDNDGCDDCAIAGIPSPLNDGPDAFGDGTCDTPTAVDECPQNSEQSVEGDCGCGFEDRLPGPSRACVSWQAFVSGDAILGVESFTLANARVGSNAQIGSDVTIGTRSIVGNNVTIGAMTIIQRSATIGHDVDIGVDVILGRSVSIGEAATVSAGVSIGYASTIEKNAFVGPGSVLGNLITVAADVTLGPAGSVTVARNVEIGAGSQLAPGVVIGPNSVLRANGQLGADVRIRKRTTIGTNSVIGAGVRIGRDTSIGADCEIAAGVRMGASSELPTGECIYDEYLVVPRNAVAGETCL
jgi:UDP-3-O-[3-hydroxymyristoyl] glucosamine N-acyltransferase